LTSRKAWQDSAATLASIYRTELHAMKFR
jgi:hypothetical protein